MTAENALAALNTGMKALTPTSLAKGASPKFVFVPGASRALLAGARPKLPDTRGFWWEMKRLGTERRVSLNRSMRVSTFTLVVMYRVMNPPYDMLKAQAADYDQIVQEVLGAPTIWNRATSGIHKVGYVGNAAGSTNFAAEFEQIEGGSLMLVDVPIKYVSPVS